MLIDPVGKYILKDILISGKLLWLSITIDSSVSWNFESDFTT